MPHNLQSSPYELGRPHNPWEKFTRRDEKKRRLEHMLQYRLGRLPFQVTPTPLPTNLPTKTTAEIIEQFLSYGSHRLDDPVPRQRQLLQDFLKAAIPMAVSASSSPSSSRPQGNYLDDIKLRSTDRDIALIDDRNNHKDCARKIGMSCTGCYIFSENVSIPDLCIRLRGEVSLF
jgi:hypothetical protein